MTYKFVGLSVQRVDGPEGSQQGVQLTCVDDNGQLVTHAVRTGEEGSTPRAVSRALDACVDWFEYHERKGV